MSRELYRQCKLRHPSGLVDVAYIPLKFAVLGKILRIGDIGEWRVVETYGTKTVDELTDARRGQKFYEDNLEPHR